MIMPDENGANTYKQLKKINPNIKVLVSSGMGKDSAVKEILNDWPNGFLPKPLKFDEFIKSVDTILSRN
jgi:DNA-binding NarL/FixJ family response regulator